MKDLLLKRLYLNLIQSLNHVANDYFNSKIGPNEKEELLKEKKQKGIHKKKKIF